MLPDRVSNPGCSVEHEKSFITSGSDQCLPSLHNQSINPGEGSDQFLQAHRLV